MPFGWFSTNVRAASCATASRLGSTSVEHIEPRDVEGEDDRRARVRDVAHDLRPAGGERERGEAGEQQGDGRCRCQRFRFGSTERSSATLE